MNAVTLDASGNQTPLHETVAAPQQLWDRFGSRRLAAYTQGCREPFLRGQCQQFRQSGCRRSHSAGGWLLQPYQRYDLRFINTQTVNSNFLHETRIGYSWKLTEQTPLSAAPSLQVAGYFAGGGATSQNLHDRERDLEIDDDVMLTRCKHSLTMGAQSLGYFVHNYDPNTFNGAYVFGGGSAPVLDQNNQPTGQTTTISGIEQYRRALLNLPGGSPTTYEITRSATWLVPFTQWRLALYAEDAIRCAPRFAVSTGLRYAFQTSPGTFANFAPRIALSWAPDKKSTWVLHWRGGLFDAPAPLSYATEVYRLNGIRQQSTIVYSPSYSNPLTPAPGSIQVGTINQFSRSVFDFLQRRFSLASNMNSRIIGAPAPILPMQRIGEFSEHGQIYAPMVASSVGVPPDPTA